MGAWLLGQETAEGVYEAALLKKEAEGDLQGAIQIFQKILKTFPDKREVAAKAQFQIGVCYEKLGTAEAIKAYELVLKNYADQPQLVTAARERLAALKQETAAGAPVVNLPLGETHIAPVAISPDGTKIAGTNLDAGINIVVHDTVTNRTEFITRFDWSEHSFGAGSPVWSPDGREIAFAQYPKRSGPQRDGPGPQKEELRATTLDGKSRLLWSNEDGGVWPVDWLQDGSAVLAIRHDDRSYTLGLIPAAGGSFRTICPINIGPWGPQAQASPDGRYVAFTEGKTGSTNIRITSIDGKWSQVIVDHPANDVHPLWSDDGRYIIFRSERQGSNALWGLAIKEGRPEGQPFMIEEILPRASLLGRTSRGIAFCRWVDINDIFVQSIDPETNEPTGKPRPISYGPMVRNSSLRWSPDGKTVAFVSSTEDYPGRVRIIVQPSQGGRGQEFLAPVLSWEPFTHALAWSPDGRRLGFATPAHNTENKQSAVFHLNLATGEWKTQPLPNIPYAFTCTEWSRDGGSFLYANHWALTDPGIVERNLETGDERYIYRPERGKNYLFWGLRRSRDNKWLVFHQDVQKGEDAGRNQAGDEQILALELETGKVRTIYAGADIGDAAWSPDGRYLLVLNAVEGQMDYDLARELGIVPFSGGPMKKLKIDVDWPAGAGFKHGFTSPDWSPDGKQIAFTARSVRDEVFLKRNIMPASRKE
jgi:Tol biopolymer transport system component